MPFQQAVSEYAHKALSDLSDAEQKAASLTDDLAKADQKIEQGVVEVNPGMVITVEIKTGSRRLIEFLLSPLLRYKQEGRWER